MKPTPKLRGLPVVGCLFDLQRDMVGTFRRAAQLGDIAELELPYVRGFLLNTPEAVDHVLHANARAYGKQTRGYAALRTVLGNGLLTSEGSFWLRQRRLAQPAFHKERLDGWAHTMVAATDARVAAWQPWIARGESFDIHHELMGLTLRVVCEAMLSTDVSDAAAEVGEALTDLLHVLVKRATRLIAWPDWLPTPAHRTLRRGRARLDSVVNRIIGQRRATGPGSDLLGMLMSATDAETGERMDDTQLRDEVMTILLAGHETTANALSWAFVTLGQHPAVEQRLREELETVLGGRAPTAADAPRLTYTAAVLSETMRLYPPVWALARSASDDDVIDGHSIPKGSLVFISPMVLHRKSDLWPEPEAFRPERFLPGAERPKARCAYLPFSSGPRKCIGDGFAMLEGQLVLARLLQQLHLTLDAGQNLEAEPLITLRPKYGVRVTARHASVPAGAAA